MFVFYVQNDQNAEEEDAVEVQFGRVGPGDVVGHKAFVRKRPSKATLGSSIFWHNLKRNRLGARWGSLMMPPSLPTTVIAAAIVAHLCVATDVV